MNLVIGGHNASKNVLSIQHLELDELQFLGSG
jgi:hypothetical protein